MIPGIQSALSGLMAFQKTIDITAHNTAHSNTDGYKRGRVTLGESRTQGVQATITRDNTPGPIVLELTAEGERPIEKSNVDLGEETTNLMLGTRFYQANLKTIKTADEMVGTLVDLVH